MSVRYLILIGLVLTATGCRTVTYSGGVPVPEHDLEREKLAKKNKLLVLQAVEIDDEARREGAKLFFTGPPPGDQFGLKRRAQGLLTLNSRDRCVAKVKVSEPIPAGGRVTQSVYTLLDFSGAVDADGDGATRTGPVFRGSASRIDIEWVSDDAAVVTVWHGDQRGAYRYRFAAGRRALNVPFPY